MEINQTRLRHQHIAGRKLKTAGELVAWMGAMQAQDYAMAKWAVGIRLPGSTVGTINAAIDAGEIIRTHVLRPTWHLIAAADVRWLLELTAPGIRRSLRSRHKELGLTEALLNKSQAIIARVLSDGRHLLRAELVAALENGNLDTGENRAAHLLMQAEIDGLICSGAERNRQPTYALLSERVPLTARLTRDEALARLGERYFSSRGPATLIDFTWWSGLTSGDAKRALAAAKPGLVSARIGEREYWLSERSPAPEESHDMAYLLPAYDELVIGYKDRAALLSETDRQKAISSNGIFRPVIMVNGRLRGLWKRTVKNGGVLVEVDYFHEPDPATNKLVAGAAEAYGRFLGLPVSVANA